MQTHQPQRYDNKHSSLLLREDNEQVFTLLGVRCQSLLTTVVQLFITHPPHHSQWIKKDTGVLCFIKDNYRKNYFFRLYCLKRNCMIWEHEVYHNMEYINSCDFLHTFEGEDCMIAFNFANVSEANEMKDIVDMKLVTKRRREEKLSKSHINVTTNIQTPRLPNMNDINFYKKSTSAAERKAKRRRNITKADIGNPSEFRHLSHVGFDPNKGFDINCDDPELNQIFEQAGVSDKQLRNRKTREFIYGFINERGGRQAVQEEFHQTKKIAPVPPSSSNSGPPVPPRSTGRASTRAAPPIPPSQNRIPQTPRSQGIGVPPPPPNGIPQPPPTNGIPQPPMLPPTCVAPPPPPPPPPCGDMSLPVEGPPTATHKTDKRSDLMDSIRTGIILKPVEKLQSQPSDNNPRGNLMSEIRKGFQLKPANEREVKPTSPLPEHDRSGGLAGALARALAERSRAIHSEDESTSDTDSYDEWEA